ncbi:hypothetical protein LSH36_1254g00001 [Paralvinella palmiformis]|uniref:Fibronectin type-III domain-containing protein n=1 Tax=Paralvinella palmiformis TaxID=53620 RepID=A0AAD9MRW3_9ANNE|nr:hypothetical protein LSH36_1254g00001 [Paralvinella palmiformis]
MTSTEVVETTPYAIECDDGFYGEMCQQECGKCAPLEPPVYNPCHRTGRCINGCKMWWAGDKCQQEIVMADYDSQSLTANVISSDRIELNLEQVNVNPGLSDFYGYRVSYGSKSLEVGHQENRSHISIKLTDLSHNSEYTVEIQPYRVMSGQRGFGNKFPKRTFRTKCIVPDPPLISSITEKQVIKVKYQAPNISGCDELTQLSLYYRYTDEDNWTLVNSNSSSGSEVSVELTESKAHVFKVIAINNEGKQSEIISPDIKVSSPEEVSIFGGNTVVSWSLFVASFIINLTVLSVLTNTYCGTSRRRATGKQAEHAPSSQGEFESGSYRPKETRTRDTNDDDGSEYTMHIFGTNDDGGRSSERRKKEKREKKEKRGKNGKKGKKQGGNAEPYTDIVLESETPTSIPEHADLGFNMNTTQSSTQDPEDDYVYTTHIDKISNKMARKMKAKKEKRKIAPHYKDSDVRENEYSVVF